MKKIIFTKREKRVIIVLMLINCFALFANFFNMDFKIVQERVEYSGEYNKYTTYITNTTYFFTDAEIDPQDFFWPILNFSVSYSKGPYEKRNSSSYYSKEYNTFRGIFSEYDYTEFLVYSALIFGIPVLRRLW